MEGWLQRPARNWMKICKYAREDAAKRMYDAANDLCVELEMVLWMLDIGFGKVGVKISKFTC